VFAAASPGPTNRWTWSNRSEPSSASGGCCRQRRQAPERRRACPAAAVSATPENTPTDPYRLGSRSPRAVHSMHLRRWMRRSGATFSAAAVVATALAATTTATSSAAAAEPATDQAPAVTVRPDPSYRGDAFEGWGTSLVWFANVTGVYLDEIRNRLADLVFGKDGLNLNIARCNICGEHAPDVPDYLRRGGAVQGWWKAPAGTTRSDTDWRDPHDPPTGTSRPIKPSVGGSTASRVTSPIGRRSTTSRPSAATCRATPGEEGVFETGGADTSPGRPGAAAVSAAPSGVPHPSGSSRRSGSRGR
jgi:hypothetical protein